MYLMKNAVQINIIIILLLQFKETIFIIWVISLQCHMILQKSF